MSLVQVPKTALFLLSDAAVAQRAARMVDGMGHRSLIVKDRNEVIAALNQESVDVLVCDLKEKAEDFPFFDAVMQSKSSPRIVAVLAEALDNYLAELIHRNYPLNLIADNHPIDYQELAVTIEKLLGGAFFGMAQYGIPVRETISFQSNGQKYDLIRQVGEFYQENKVSGRIVKNVELILNELLMNAVFDAPVNEQGQSQYYHLKRSTIVDCEPNRAFELSYGINERWLGVSVTDLFGTFEPRTFFSHIRRRVAKEPLNNHGPGTGMGLFLIFKSLDKLIVNVAPGQKTEVIALLDHHTSAGALKKRRHSFHHFIQEPAQTSC